VGTKDITEARLNNALARLLKGQPERVKKQGKLSLNRINNEAGLGHSYIHKFKDFVDDIANPAIEKFNKEYDPNTSENDDEPSSDVEKLQKKLKKEIALKTKYRKERDEAIMIQKELETLNSTLMFRVYELQEKLRSNNIIELSHSK